MPEATGPPAKLSPARQMAYRILLRADLGREFAVDLLQRDDVSRLQDADRRLTTELVMGVLRWRGVLDFEIERLSGKAPTYFDPEILAVLRLGVYQIQRLQRVPKPAAVNQAVELAKAARKRSAAGLVNAVLRKCEPRAPSSREPQGAGPKSTAGLTDDQRLAHAVPPWLLGCWERHFGQETARRLARSSLETPPTTLRVAEGEAAREAMQQELAQAGVQTRTGEYASAALVVERGDVRSSEAWRQGRVVIQDEASQLAGALVAPQPGERVLDLCAAPGIKAAQLISGLGKGTLVACDRSARRMRTMTKLLGASTTGPQPGGVRVEFVQLDAARPLPFAIQFDRVLLDAPCSGTGTLARNPEIKWRLGAGDIVRLAQAQAAMLRSGLELLKPGGRLVYATCSLEPEENEQVVEQVLAEPPADQPAGRPRARLATRQQLVREFPRLAALFDDRGYFRTLPGVHPTDGFFAAVCSSDRL
ncbi:MAG TPA: 16S rRNA (cytosine(967)-C(5))-methyltransferase RsmB [Terriglobia bacterium]|nr:16S rRNA (cytosine(967)-C(5))-methyltransferase RsmB [Terriglobia bacterium]